LLIFSKKAVLSFVEVCGSMYVKRSVVAGIGVVLALGVLVLIVRPHAAPGVQGLTVGGPFSLMDGAGKSVTDRDFRGKFMLMYFGYTHCPDVCPTTLAAMGAAMDRLPPAARARIVPVFITVDPERDTPSVVGAYARAFGPEFVGLTGSAAAIGTAEREYRVYAQKHVLEGGDYAMDHSSVIYVMGPDGSFVTVLDDQMAPGTMAQQLLKLGV
jgi:protein SCO1/2